MTFWTLIWRSLRYHVRAHFGVVLGAAVGTAALTGALLVGDSVRETLRRRALERLGTFEYALAPADRLFEASLAKRLATGPAVKTGSIQSVLMLPAVLTAREGAARANQTLVLGVDASFFSTFATKTVARLQTNQALLNAALADQVGVRPGDEILVRVLKPNALSGDVSLTTRENSGAVLRLIVAGVLSAEAGGDFSLQRSQLSPLNVFLHREPLASAAGVPGKANLLVTGVPRAGVSSEQAEKELAASLRDHWLLGDASLELRSLPEPGAIELRSSRAFLEPAAVEAATSGWSRTDAQPVLTYLANTLEKGSQKTPYSFVTAAGPPWTPADLRDNEIMVSQWLADDLRLIPGDDLSITYFLPESGAKLLESTNRFRVRAILNGKLPWSDRTLMPDFPGLEKAETTKDWDFGFELVHEIRPKDEDYWKQHRGTPKAFITLAAGQKLWGNRFGNLTAIRWPLASPSAAEASIGRDLLSRLDPATLGLKFEPVRDQALKSVTQSQDFGQLFLGFSFFVVIAALLLMAMLFQLGLEQRTVEVGTLLALGFTPAKVRRLIWAEGVFLALVGGLIGLVGGLLYSKLMLLGLASIWRGAVGTSALQFFAKPQTLIVGGVASVTVAVLTIWFASRKQARQPARELLTQGGAGSLRFGKGRGKWLALTAGAGAVLILGRAILKGETANAGAFFGAGALLLVAGLAATAAWLGSLTRHGSSKSLTLLELSIRSAARRRNRSLTTIALLACGCFVVVAVGAFRLDASRDAALKTSGTGGFALLGESAMPIYQDLNSRSGREFFGFNDQDLAGVNLVPLRVRQGDEASCLNLTRAQKPRVLGVNPQLLVGRFTFASAAKGLNRSAGWELLRASGEAVPDEVAAIGDANSIQWALGKKVGDTLDYTDDHGRTFRLRLVGAVANSILQGSLLIDEAQFIKRFPNQGGYKMFLVDLPQNAAAKVSTTLSRALQDAGLEITSTERRMAALNAVQNTYLGTFQVLGGLGLLLGSAGLGVIVMRNVLERRGELGLFQAVGFQPKTLTRLVLAEHAVLLFWGLLLGIFAALIAVFPSFSSPAARVPYLSLAVTLVAVFFNGLLWTWAATRYAMRGNLLAALRNE
jgi:putative ABC transport system permease protein